MVDKYGNKHQLLDSVYNFIIILITWVMVHYKKILITLLQMVFQPLLYHFFAISKEICGLWLLIFLQKNKLSFSQETFLLQNTDFQYTGKTHCFLLSHIIQEWVTKICLSNTIFYLLPPFSSIFFFIKICTLTQH